MAVVFYLLIAMLIGCLLVLHSLRKKPQAIIVEHITEQQRHISAAWAADRRGKVLFLELRLIGQIVEGSCLQGNSVLNISNGTYFPPNLSFCLTTDDGSELNFTGRISSDGKNLAGCFSDFHEREELKFSRLPVTNLAPLLVYSALDAVLRASVTMVPEYGLETIATLIDTSELGEPLLLNPSLPPEPGPGRIVAPGRGKSTVGVSIPSPAMVALQSSPDSAVLAVSSKATEPVHVSVQRCPECNVEWTEAFAFCLHCGYTP